MKKSLIILAVIIGFSACKQNNRFHVAGKITDAANQMLYIEHNGLLKTTVIDSVKLGSDGEFSFKAARPKYPDFYCLRLNDRVITFAVDSCEDISIDAKNSDFSTNYTVRGSLESAQIQQLRISLMNIQQKANSLAENMSADERNAKIDEIKKDIEAHKDKAKKLILTTPGSLSAYFAIYQKVNDTYLFSPYVKEDAPFCKAVATFFNAFMPDYERTKNLYSLVIDAIKSERSAMAKEVWNNVLQKVGKGYIDLVLNDKNNQKRKLSELEGKVVLLDFSSYESKESVDYTFALRDLYNKYHTRGFEIYQVSVDRNKLLWQQSVENIPWICVREESESSTNSVTTYNVNSIPTCFLMDKKGNIIVRSPGFNVLDKLIQKNL